jgi:hypothetical protein
MALGDGIPHTARYLTYMCMLRTPIPKANSDMMTIPAKADLVCDKNGSLWYDHHISVISAQTPGLAAMPQ